MAAVERCAVQGGTALERNKLQIAAVRRSCRALSAVVFLATALVAAPGLGEVRLDTVVHLVQTVVGEAGQIQHKMVDLDLVAPGDELRYTIRFTNTGLVAVDGGAIVITNPLPDSTEYMHGSAGGGGTRILFATDGEWPVDEGVESAAAFAPFAALVRNDDGAGRPAIAPVVRAIRWIYEPPLPPGASGEVWFHVRLLAAEPISNSVFE